MIDALKQFFQSKLAAASTPAAVPEAAENALRLAAGVLLFEIVRADHRIEDSERTVMRTALQSTFDLAADETEEVMRLAEEQSRLGGTGQRHRAFEHRVQPYALGAVGGRDDGRGGCCVPVSCFFYLGSFFLVIRPSALAGGGKGADCYSGQRVAEDPGLRHQQHADDGLPSRRVTGARLATRYLG